MLSQVGMPYEECIQALKSLRSDYVRPTGPGTVVSSRTAAMASLWGMNTPFSSLFRPKWSLSMDGRPSSAAGLSLKRAPASNPRLAKLQASPFGNFGTRSRLSNLTLEHGNPFGALEKASRDSPPTKP